MSESEQRPPLDPQSLRDWIDEMADRFDTAWQAASSGSVRPKIEDFLTDADEPRRGTLLCELILLDIEYRQQAKETPKPEDYSFRFPTLETHWLESAMKAVPAGDDRVPVTRAARIRCPHCQSPIQLVDDRPEEVLCPSCGSSFRLRDTRMTSTVGHMRQIGKFQLLERLGLGAFGAVWKARDTVLDKIVALKIPHAGSRQSDADRERFYREARAAANLRHPGIVTVHEVAELQTESGKLLALVTDYVDGVTLRELLTQRRLTFRESASLIAELAEALDYAHSMGVVHRDIKPANIILEYPVGLGLSAPLDQDSTVASSARNLPLPLGEGRGEGVDSKRATSASQSLSTDRIPHPNPLPAGEGTGAANSRAVRPRPLILDFGLALRDEAEATMTVDGQILGTPAYMSPEQAVGQSHRVDARSDVYTLGVILYELLCNELPFRGSRVALIRQITYEEPIPLRRVREKIPRDLETITLKCLCKLPDRRYLTARAMADDLRRWLGGEPIQARPTSQMEKLWLWSRRNPTVAGLTGTVSLLLLAIACGSLVIASRERALRSEATKARTEATDKAVKEAQARADAVAQEQLAKGEARRARHHLYDTHMNLAQAAWYDARIATVLDHLERHRNPTSRDEDFRGFEWYYLDRLCRSELLTLEGPSKSAIQSIAFSPDGRRLASGRIDGTVELWDAVTGQPSPTFQRKTGMGYVTSVAFSPDGQRLAATTAYDAVLVWDAENGQELLQLKGHSGWVRGVAFSPDGKRIASAGCDGLVKVWDSANGHELAVLKGHSDWVYGVTFSPKGNQLASCGKDGTVRTWDIQGERESHTLRGHSHGVACVTFSPDGQRLASAGDDGTVRVWDADNERELIKLVGHTPAAMSVAYSVDGRTMASADTDSTIRVWDAATGQQRFMLKGHSGPASSVAFSPDDRRLASGSEDGTIKVWNAISQESHSFEGHTRDLRSVAFSGDGKWLASASSDQTVKIWDATSGRCVRTLTGHVGRIHKVAISPDSHRLATAGQDQTVKVWDTMTGNELFTFKEHSGPVYSVAFSPDGLQVASASNDQTVKVWDAMNGDEISTLADHSGPVYSVAFNPNGLGLAASCGGVAFAGDGSWIGSAGGDGVIKVWDLATRQLRLSLKGHSGWSMSVAFSKDGQRLASTGADATVRLWDTTTGKQLHALRGHRSAVFSVAFSPDGRRLASAGSDNSAVKIWDATSGDEVLTLKGQFGDIWDITFSPDGQRLAAAGSRATVTVWDSRPWTSELRAEQQALNIVSILSRKGLSNSGILHEIASDRTIDERVRNHANQLAGE